MNHAVAINDHVVSKIIEPKLIVCAVRYVAVVRRASLVRFEFSYNASYREAQKAMYFAHPLGVALGKVIVHRNNVYAVSVERVKI